MKFSNYVLAVLLPVFLLLSTGPAAFAATSQATITFTVDGTPEVLDPVDPDSLFDPADPSNPDDEATGNTGLLTLDYVSSVDFGTQKVSMSARTYSSTTRKPFIQVTDRRGDGGLGWSVTAKATPFKDATAVTGLNGAVLTFKNGTAATTTGNDFPAPGTVVSEVILSTDNTAAEVVTAAPGQGVGPWLIRWLSPSGSETNQNVTLSVPAGAASEGAFTSTITWTLSATPTS